MVGSRRQLGASVAASLLVCSLVAPALAMTAVATPQSNALAAPSSNAFAAQHTGAGQLAFASTQDFEANRTEFHITVYENGSATWRFRYERTLTSEEQRRNFEAFAEDFNANETELYTNFRRRAVALTEVGTNETGRNMSATAFHRHAAVEGFDESLGVVEMSFRWEGFARTNGRVVVGDVFEGGLYLAPDQRLVIGPGPGLQFAAIEPDDGRLSGETLAGSDTVTWEGERSFTDNRPRVEFVEAGETPAPGTGPSSGTPGWLLPIGVFVVVLLLGLGAAVAYRSGALGSDGGFSPGGGSGSSDSGPGGGVTASDAGGVETEPAVPEEELVADDERVVDLLERNGGRMKQVDIVEETGWSKSKVSMLLSDMEESGDISKLRVGRENIVSLSGHEPDAAGSPFDDE